MLRPFKPIVSTKKFINEYEAMSFRVILRTETFAIGLADVSGAIASAFNGKAISCAITGHKLEGPAECEVLSITRRNGETSPSETGPCFFVEKGLPHEVIMVSLTPAMSVLEALVLSKSLGTAEHTMAVVAGNLATYEPALASTLREILGSVSSVNNVGVVPENN